MRRPRRFPILPNTRSYGMGCEMYGALGAADLERRGVRQGGFDSAGSAVEDGVNVLRPRDRRPHRRELPERLPSGSVWTASSRVPERYEARHENQGVRVPEMDRDFDVREYVMGCIFLILLLAAFAAAGTQDMIDDRVWRESWYEQNGVAE